VRKGNCFREKAVNRALVGALDIANIGAEKPDKAVETIMNFMYLFIRYVFCVKI
jgi:hypothetical protein